MLTDQQLESAKQSKIQYEFIANVVDTLPEDQWMTTIVKTFPDASRFSIMQDIMIHCGGDIIVNGKQSLG